MRIGSRLRRIREEADLTAAAVAKLLGMSRGNLSMLEAGKRPLKVETLIEWSGVLGYETHVFLLPTEGTDVVLTVPQAAEAIGPRLQVLRGERLHLLLRVADTLVRATPSELKTLNAMVRTMEEMIDPPTATGIDLTELLHKK